jgi:hypothetical protein
MRDQHAWEAIHQCHAWSCLRDVAKLAVMYLQRGPPIAENEPTTHRTHRRSTRILGASANPYAKHWPRVKPRIKTSQLTVVSHAAVQPCNSWSYSP